MRLGRRETTEQKLHVYTQKTYREINNVTSMTSVSFSIDELATPLGAFQRDAAARLLPSETLVKCVNDGGGSVRASPEGSYMMVVDWV